MELIKAEVDNFGIVSVYGEYDIEKGGYGEEEYEYPEFYELTATRVIDGKETPYSPKGRTFRGRKLNPTDIITKIISGLMLGEKGYKAIYLEDRLQKLVNEYKSDSITIGGQEIPKKILYGYEMEQYSLKLVTEDFIYYCDEEKTVMFSMEDKEVVSDNIFAENAYIEALENEGIGQEKILWKED